LHVSGPTLGGAGDAMRMTVVPDTADSNKSRTATGRICRVPQRRISMVTSTHKKKLTQL
jgi:hypothetical protein